MPAGLLALDTEVSHFIWNPRLPAVLRKSYELTNLSLARPVWTLRMQAYSSYLAPFSLKDIQYNVVVQKCGLSTHVKAWMSPFLVGGGRLRTVLDMTWQKLL